MEQDRLRPGVDAWLPRLSGLVLSDLGTTDLRAAIVELATEIVDGVDDANVWLFGDVGAGPDQACGRNEPPGSFDAAQRAAAAGPTVECLRSGTEVWWEPGDGRWPELVEPSDGRSAWALPLQAGDHLVGVLTLRGTAVGPHADAADDVRLLAHYAAVVLHNAAALMGAELTNRHLQAALENRDVIGQAKGMLMARRGVDADEAFDLLRRASQRSGRKLRDVAGEVVARYGPSREA